jgi:molecular chaperone HscB
MPNPFELLGLPPRFDLDASSLHQRFIAALSATHPDHFVVPLEQADAAERAAQFNEAYRVLADPEARANALLELLGGPAREQDKSLPPELLGQMMEVREAWDAAAAADDQATLTQLRTWADDQHRQTLAAVASLFFSVDLPGAVDSPTDSRDRVLKDLRLKLNALRYFQRMLDQAPPSP